MAGTMTTYLRFFPVLMCSFLAIFMIVQYYIPITAFTSVAASLSEYYSIANAALIAMAIFNLWFIHGRKIQRREKGNWPYSIYTIILSGVTLVAGVLLGTGQADIQWFFAQVSLPAETAIYGMNVFWAASAIYRSFKVRTIESLALVVTGILVTFYTTALFPGIIPGIDAPGRWLLTYPGAGVFRSFEILARLGGIFFLLRIIAGYERIHLGAT